MYSYHCDTVGSASQAEGDLLSLGVESVRLWPSQPTTPHSVSIAKSVHSFNKYLLNASSVIGNVLGVWDTSLNKI